MEPTSEKLSPFDFMAAIFKGGRIFDQSNASSESASPVAMLMDNKELMAMLTTSVAVLVGCVFLLMWRRASSSPKKAVEPPNLAVAKAAEETEEADDGRKKVTIFFGTQTGTAEGFAKVCELITFITFRTKNKKKIPIF